MGLQTCKFLKLSKATAGGGPPKSLTLTSNRFRLESALVVVWEATKWSQEHQEIRIYHLASNWDGMCGPNMLLNSAQSAPEANFLSKIPKVPKLPQLGRISKIPKITKLPKRPSSKICFRSCRGRDFLKVSIIRGCENLRGTLCLDRLGVRGAHASRR